MQDRPYSVEKVANSFLELADINKRPLTPLQLQKLIYFAQGWHLALLDRPLLNQPFEAYQHGPVLSSLHAELIEYGIEHIPSGYRLVEHVTDETMPLIKIDSIPLQDAEAQSIIKFVWDKYSEFDGVKLSAMTHEDRSKLTEPGPHVRHPWRTAWKTASEEKLIKKEISNEDIKNYFRLLKKHNKLF